MTKCHSSDKTKNNLKYYELQSKNGSGKSFNSGKEVN